MPNISWNDENVTTNSPDELLKIQVLIRRGEANDALRSEEERIYQFGVNRKPGRYRSYLLALWREIAAGYIAAKGRDKRLDYGDPAGIGVNLYTEGASFEQLRELHDLMEEYLYEKKVTQFRQYADPKDPERMS